MRLRLTPVRRLKCIICGLAAAGFAVSCADLGTAQVTFPTRSQVTPTSSRAPQLRRAAVETVSVPQAPQRTIRLSQLPTKEPVPIPSPRLTMPPSETASGEFLSTPGQAPSTALPSPEFAGGANSLSMATMVGGVAAWWEPTVAAPTREDAQPVAVTVDALIVSALRNSAQIKVFSDLPLIRETAITEADAAFDWIGFMESRWDDLNEPVGSTLTTGGPTRFKDRQFSYAAGARRRNVWGGEFEVSQRIGYQDNNSVFFVPNDQGTARLTASYTQPLLRGAGRVYNTSLTVLASIDTQIARDEFSRQLQSHLLEVTRAYWSLYLERGSLCQKQRLLSRAEDILQKLEERRELDSVASQVVRARSAVTARRAEIMRAEMAVRNAESRIRALTNDPLWGSDNVTELVPGDAPFRSELPVDLGSSIATAMQYRPEIGQALKQVKAACIRMDMAKNEILPALNLVLETYVSGLRGDSRIGEALESQFTEGAPSYSAGLQYEMPIWNRAAKARLQRRRLEVRQLQNQFQTTAQTLKLEVAVAVRELMTSFRELDARAQAMEAADGEVEYITQRWQALGAADRSASLMLEDLLNAQSRLANAEFEYLNSSVTYNLALMNYKKAVGTLLQEEQILMNRNCDCNLPGQHPVKANAG